MKNKTSKELRCAFCGKVIAKDVSNQILIKEKWLCSKECSDGYHKLASTMTEEEFNKRFTKP